MTVIIGGASSCQRQHYWTFRFQNEPQNYLAFRLQDEPQIIWHSDFRMNFQHSFFIVLFIQKFNYLNIIKDLFLYFLLSRYVKIASPINLAQYCPINSAQDCPRISRPGMPGIQTNYTRTESLYLSKWLQCLFVWQSWNQSL